MEHGKRVSTLFKLERQHLYHIYWSTGRQLSRRKSLLVIRKSLRLFVNTMSPVDKCSLPNKDNLMQPIHMQLSQKLKTFSALFNVFLKCRSNFEYFQKKDDLIAYLFLRLRSAKNVVRYMCKKSRFRKPFQKEHGKWVSTLFKFEKKHLCHIHGSKGA